MSDLKTKFDELIAEQKELARKFQETAQSLFKETMKEFWAKNPGVKALVWTQYTPFFQDGDECVFRVNDVYFTNAEGDDLFEYSHSISWGEYNGENEDVWIDYGGSYMGTHDGVDKESCVEISHMIGCGDMEPIMRAMFGDHVIVIATKDGFDVDEYDHD